MFEVDELVAACVACLGETDPRRAVHDTLERVLERPEVVPDRLRPERASITLLHHTPQLTIIDVVWAPGMRIFAHDHRMWAAIAVYVGREDNEFFRRALPGAQGLVASDGRTLRAGDVVVLGDDTIHAVANPTAGPTGAIHVYGGDFVRAPRSQWRPPTLDEEPYESGVVAQVFEDANAAWARGNVSNDLSKVPVPPQ